MTEWVTERFRPGPLFAWLCLIFFVLLPLIWFRARDAGRRREAHRPGYRGIDGLGHRISLLVPRCTSSVTPNGTVAYQAVTRRWGCPRRLSHP